MSYQLHPCSRVPTQVYRYTYNLGKSRAKVSSLETRCQIEDKAHYVCLVSLLDYTYAGQTSSKRQGILAIFDFMYNQLQNIFSDRSAKSF